VGRLGLNCRPTQGGGLPFVKKEVQLAVWKKGGQTRKFPKNKPPTRHLIGRTYPNGVNWTKNPKGKYHGKKGKGWER